jgi:LacI family transcriptional regulator
MRMGMHACAREHRWSIISEFGDMGFLEHRIAESKPAAALVYLCSPKVVMRAKRLVPTVAAISDMANLPVPSIDVDEAAVARAAADHLLGLWLRHFAVFGTWSSSWAAARCRTFEQQITKAGFECHRSTGKELRERRAESAVASRRLMGRWLASLPKPIAIFAACDRWGHMLVNQCRAIGLRVPEDVSVVGVDNDEVVCEMTEPPLSSVAINWQRVGYDAAMLAGKLARGEPVETVLRLEPPVGVVIRQSSDLLAVEDRDVASVLSIIRRRAAGPLTVGEILQEVPVDRHRLEKRFREQVGRRILREVRRVRVEKAKRLLVSTDLLMPQIAERSGFANATKLGIAFREETGTTPTAFRGEFRLPL